MLQHIKVPSRGHVSMFHLFISKDPPMTHFYKKAHDFFMSVSTPSQKKKCIIASSQPTRNKLDFWEVKSAYTEDDVDGVEISIQLTLLEVAQKGALSTMVPLIHQRTHDPKQKPLVLRRLWHSELSQKVFPAPANWVPRHLLKP